jgi:DNA polymerase-1
MNPLPPIPIALVDCDFTVYRACAAAETEIDLGKDVILVQSSFSEAMKIIHRDLDRTKAYLTRIYEVEPHMVLCFSHHTNFRKCVDPSYKGHRNRKKPCGYVRAIKELAKTYKQHIIPGLEADDVMGIHSQLLADVGFEAIICSPDKDMRQIAGKLWDLNPENPITHITEEQAWRWFLTQTLTGDQTDGYSGVPGIGQVKADSLLDSKGVVWETVEEAFIKAGLTRDDALRNARLARILTAHDFDFATGEPRLWTPREAGSDGSIHGDPGLELRPVSDRAAASTLHGDHAATEATAGGLQEGSPERQVPRTVRRSSRRKAPKDS